MDWDVLDVGTLAYAPALAQQRELNLAVSRGERRAVLMLVEHEPVVTVSHRRDAAGHVLASPEELQRLGIDRQDTDRGGDVTYHGPGQLVAYPILRLNDHGLNLGRYMRLLEEAVIETVATFGVLGQTERGATGVWVEVGSGVWGLGFGGNDSGGATNDFSPRPQTPNPRPQKAKLCALGVRIRKNTTMHGLALNVTTDLTHFATIDPCGLGGRPVTSLAALLGAACPPIAEVKQVLIATLGEALARLGREMRAR